MQPSPIGRFSKRFITKFWATLRQSVFDRVVALVTIAYFFVRGLVSQRWEFITPVAWAICLILGYHALEAAVAISAEISREIKEAPGEKETSILSPSGARATVSVTPVRPRFYRLQLCGTASLILALCGWASYFVWHIEKEGNNFTQPVVIAPTQVTVAPTEVYMDCHQMALPIHIAPNATAHVKAFNKKQYGNTKWAMFDIRNDGPTERLWPDLKLIKSVKHNPGAFGYECDVSNHAQANLIDLAINMNANFDNEKEPLVYTAIISPLDAGNTFSFYLINECPLMVSVISPDAVTVQVFGEDRTS